MALLQRQELRQAQTQGLVMTPQLQQAIKLLQLSTLDLAAFIEGQLAENPLLERIDGDGEPGETPAAEGPPADGDLGALAGDLDTDFENVWDADGPAPNGSGPGYATRGGGFEDGDFSADQLLTERPSLRDHVMAQAHLELPDPGDRLIAAHLVDMLDEAGYLHGDLDAVAALLGCPTTRIETVLASLQRLDPPGVFARSLAECLALQLRDRNRLDPAMQTLLDNLDLLARRDMAALEAICGVDAEDLADMVRELRRLQPKPALAYDLDPVQPVVPDILMRQHPEDGWVVELNADALPRVLVDGRYYARVRGSCRTRQDRDYVTEQYNAANWLVKSLHQRASTVLKVASEIVRRQDAFFVRGIAYLRPLTLRDIAEAIDMHESTVSRVTSNKYIATPRGLFELKYFFSAAIQSANGGEAHSAEAVRHRIRLLIDREPPAGVLSDDRIVDILRSSGIDIARRTVAKYREAMHIPSSVQRRREKMAGLGQPRA